MPRFSPCACSSSAPSRSAVWRESSPMSSRDVAISIRSLSKSYTIVSNVEKHITIAETVLDRARNPFRRPETEIVDEVLAVGDAAFQKKCLGKMGDVAKSGRTVLFVSHNMEAIRRLCSRCVVVEAGSVLKDASTGEALQTYLELLREPGRI